MISLKNRQLRNIVFLYTVAFIYWISTIIYRECYKKDIEVLNKNVILGCNGWCVSHFIHYLCLGYFAPSYWKELILIGIGFELFESSLDKMSKYINGQLMEDTIINTTGVLVGYILYKLFPTEIRLWN